MLFNYYSFTFTFGSLALNFTSLRFDVWAFGSNIAVVLHRLTKPQLGNRNEVDLNRLDSRFTGKVWPKAFRLSLEMRHLFAAHTSEFSRKVDPWGGAPYIYIYIRNIVATCSFHAPYKLHTNWQNNKTVNETNS